MIEIPKRWPAIMTDLETMGNGPRSAIVSIGAVAFDPMGQEPLEDLPSFYCNVDLQSCFDSGLVADGSTVMWWLGQSEEARKALATPDPVHLNCALNDFRQWIVETGVTDYKLWAHGTFDPVILRSAFDAAKLGSLPWKYRDTRDIRTLAGLARKLGYEAPKSGGDNSNNAVKHQAVDDCRYQVGYVRTMYQMLIGKTEDCGDIAQSRKTSGFLEPEKQGFSDAGCSE